LASCGSPPVLFSQWFRGDDLRQRHAIIFRSSTHLGELRLARELGEPLAHDRREPPGVVERAERVQQLERVPSPPSPPRASLRNGRAELDAMRSPSWGCSFVAVGRRRRSVVAAGRCGGRVRSVDSTNSIDSVDFSIQPIRQFDRFVDSIDSSTR
jgi:hypothetical protein